MSPGDPAPRHSPKYWQDLREAKLLGQSCRGGCGAQAAELVYLVGLETVADNVIPLCANCRTVYEERGDGWRQVADAIRSSLSPAEHAYILEKQGGFFLDRYYPALIPSCPLCRTELDQGMFCSVCGWPPYREAA
jgi:hypothetical protein